MSEELIIGLLALGVPLFAAGYLMLRRNAGIFRMFSAMLIIGLGYLALTGALSDIGRSIMTSTGLATSPEAPMSAPAAAAPAAPETTAPATTVPETPVPETPAAPPEAAPAPQPAPAPP